MTGEERKWISPPDLRQLEFYVRKRFRTIPSFPTEAERERFWSKVNILGHDECWFWNGHRVNGYGNFYFRPPISASYPAHRIAYSDKNAADITDFVVCHRCDNPPCINPSHLVLGTHLANMMDMYQKGIHRAHKKSGQLYSNRIFLIKKL